MEEILHFLLSTCCTYHYGDNIGWCKISSIHTGIMDLGFRVRGLGCKGSGVI